MLNVWGKTQQLFGGAAPLILVKLNAAFSTERAIEMLQNHPMVHSVQPNFIYNALGCPVPDSSSDAYNTSSTINQPCGAQLVNPDWPFAQVKAPCAWNTLSLAMASCPAAPGSAITVAILDSGIASTNIQTNHPDLPSTLFATGYNAFDGSANTIDDYGHGTHVAGILAAQWNNAGIANPCTLGTVPGGSFNGGIAGMAGYPGLLKIIPVKVLDNTGTGSTAGIIQGVYFAVANGAKILNFSLGTYANDPQLQTAIQWAVDNCCVVVASAGNDSYTAGSVIYLYPLRYPALYASTMPGVIAVGATNASMARAYYSNGGPGLSIMAPGGEPVTAGFDTANNILSCMLNCPIPASPANFTFDPCDSNYAISDGTSMAAPFISGTIAMMLALNPLLPNYQIKTIIETTAVDIYGGPVCQDRFYLNLRWIPC